MATKPTEPALAAPAELVVVAGGGALAEPEPVGAGVVAGGEVAASVTEGEGEPVAVAVPDAAGVEVLDAVWAEAAAVTALQ